VKPFREGRAEKGTCLMKLLALAVLASALSAQDGPKPPASSATPPGSSEPGVVLPWKEGAAIGVRVPVVGADLKRMTTIAFPEERIEAVVSGWGEELSVSENGNRLFLRLLRKAEGELAVVGGSGTHYLFYLVGVEPSAEGAYDRYVRIAREEPKSKEPPSLRGRRRPTGSVALLQAMRLGERPEGARILRAAGEPAFRSETVVLRLAYVYLTQDFAGYVYELENLTGVPQALDASRFRAREGTLVLTALRENLVPARGKTRLYAVFWRD
jgi:hypothetical protein